jgi:hypothetical protein
MSAKNTQDSKSLLHCEHCGRDFVREGSFQRHICEAKRRWQDQNRPANRIAYAAWLEFYRVCQPSRRRLEYRDFAGSAYYTAFVRWGVYCCDIGAVAADQFARYLVRNNTAIDNWASDQQYTQFITDYVRQEQPLDAVRRGIEYLLSVCEQENMRIPDVLRFYSPNKLCMAIARGQLTGWVLYQCADGLEFLGKLNNDQRALVFDYINPENWTIRFRRFPEAVAEVQAVLAEAMK